MRDGVAVGGAERCAADDAWTLLTLSRACWSGGVLVAAGAECANAWPPTVSGVPACCVVLAELVGAGVGRTHRASDAEWTVSDRAWEVGCNCRHGRVACKSCERCGGAVKGRRTAESLGARAHQVPMGAPDAPLAGAQVAGKRSWERGERLGAKRAPRVLRATESGGALGVAAVAGLLVPSEERAGRCELFKGG